MATRRVKADGFYNTYIGPASKWANPFVSPRDGDNKQVVLKFKNWVYSQPQLQQEIRAHLKDKALGCWCQKGQLCHGDVLVTVAESVYVNPVLPLRPSGTISNQGLEQPPAIEPNVQDIIDPSGDRDRETPTLPDVTMAVNQVTQLITEHYQTLLQEDTEHDSDSCSICNLINQSGAA